MKMSKTGTIYRKCSCGETAHDMKASKIEGGWSYHWACRNCGNLAVNLRGLAKTKIVMDDGRKVEF